MIEEIMNYYVSKKEKIDNFLNTVRNNYHDKNKVLFELMFCISVPQSKAPICRSCLEGLVKNRVLIEADKKKLASALIGIRFNNNKAKYMILARDNFNVIFNKIYDLKDEHDELRIWIVQNVKGIGMKEASHFLRNIGLGEELAIFDIHVLRTMQEMQLIKTDKKITATTERRYLEYEKMFQNLAKKHGLKPAQLDIAIWLMRSGNNDIM